MAFIPKDIISKLILIISLLTIWYSVKYIWAQEKWSPIDEYAHMDYIECVGEGKLPVLSNSISEEIFQNIKNDSLRNWNHNIISREQLGITNNSYEAIHPPVYYTTLAIPNLLLKKMHLPIFERLKILREISYFIFVLGMYLSIPLFKNISKLGYIIPDFFSYGCFLFGLLFIVHQRYGLGNNMMSPLIVNLTSISLIKYIINPRSNIFFLFIVLSGVSVFTAISNIFIIPWLLLIGFYNLFLNFSSKTLLSSLLIILGFVLLFFYWKYMTKPDPFIAGNFKNALNSFIPAGIIDYYTFLYLLTEDAFTLNLIDDKLNCTYIILLLFSLNTIIGISNLKIIIKQHNWFFIFSMILIGLSIITFILNKYIAGIHWVAFRHYLGFIPIIYLSCFGFLIILYSKYFNKNCK